MASRYIHETAALSRCYAPSSAYRGRLAPSPTGYLHVGHARTFWTAFQRAREAGGTLVMRMEDLDPDRSRAGLRRCRARRSALAGHSLAGGPGQGRALRALCAEQAPRHLPRLPGASCCAPAASFRAAARARTWQTALGAPHERVTGRQRAAAAKLGRSSRR